MKRAVSRTNVALVVGVALGLLASTSGHAQTVVNGDFGTGDLTGFHVFTTPNGDNGTGAPDVESFDVTGSGATNAAHFQVGQSVEFTGAQGGGIYQDINFAGSGNATFSADIAAVGGPLDNNAGGFFQLLVDNVLVDSYNAGFLAADAIQRATLTGSVFVSAGSHELRIQITRPFPDTVVTPNQYVTNIRVNGQFATTPEGSSLFLLSTGLLPLAACAHWKRKLAKTPLQ